MKFLILSYARQANKEMYLSAMAYNLKKYLKFIGKTVESNAKTMHGSFSVLKAIFGHETRWLGPLGF